MPANYCSDAPIRLHSRRCALPASLQSFVAAMQFYVNGSRANVDEISASSVSWQSVKAKLHQIAVC